MMADVTSYARCTMAFARGALVYNEGEVRAVSDPAVSQNPNYWTVLTDVAAASGDLIIGGVE